MGIDNSNPFVMPGFGQTGDASQNPLMASMDMMRRAWQGMAGAGGMESVAMAAPMSVEDLERRISDLRAVENWLRLNLSMLSSTIQGLEVQRSTIATLMSFAANTGVPAGASASAQSATPSPLEAVLGIKPGSWQASFGATESAPAAAQEVAGKATPEAKDAATAAQERADYAAEAATAYASSAETAVKGWWDMLQKQFDTLASATTAGMPNADAPADSMVDKAAANNKTKPAAPASAKAAKPVKSPAKTAAKAAKAPVAKKATAPKAAVKAAARKTAAKRTPAGKA